ncbi:hypothetical protein AK812_SmicGene784, partial [Symbiodinium microadriaticum]
MLIALRSGNVFASADKDATGRAEATARGLPTMSLVRGGHRDRQDTTGTSHHRNPTTGTLTGTLTETRPNNSTMLRRSKSMLKIAQASPVQPDVRTEAFQWLAAQPKLWKGGNAKGEQWENRPGQEGGNVVPERSKMSTAGTQAQHRLVDLVRGTWSAWQRRMLRLLRLLRLYEGHDFMATSPSAATAALRTNPEIQTNSEGPASKLLGRVETQGQDKFESQTADQYVNQKDDMHGDANGCLDYLEDYEANSVGASAAGASALQSQMIFAQANAGDLSQTEPRRLMTMGIQQTRCDKVQCADDEAAMVIYSTGVASWLAAQPGQAGLKWKFPEMGDPEEDSYMVRYLTDARAASDLSVPLKVLPAGRPKVCISTNGARSFFALESKSRGLYEIPRLPTMSLVRGGHRDRQADASFAPGKPNTALEETPASEPKFCRWSLEVMEATTLNDSLCINSIFWPAQPWHIRPGQEGGNVAPERPSKHPKYEDERACLQHRPEACSHWTENDDHHSSRFQLNCAFTDCKVVDLVSPLIVLSGSTANMRRVLHLGCKLPSPSPATYWAGMGDAWPVIHAMLPAFAECYRTRGGGGGAPNLSVPQALQAEGWHACPSWGATLQGTLAHAAPHVPLQMRSHAEVFMNAAKVVGIAPPLGFYCRNASSNSTSSSSSSGMKAATGRAKPLLEQTAAKALRLNIDSWTWSEALSTRLRKNETSLDGERHVIPCPEEDRLAVPTIQIHGRKDDMHGDANGCLDYLEDYEANSVGASAAGASAIQSQMSFTQANAGDLSLTELRLMTMGIQQT